VIDKPVILGRARPQHHAEGHHWTLAGKTLSISLDDSTLPTPYVIDPIINIQPHAMSARIVRPLPA